MCHDVRSCKRLTRLLKILSNTHDESQQDGSLQGEGRVRDRALDERRSTFSAGHRLILVLTSRDMPPLTFHSTDTSGQRLRAEQFRRLRKTHGCKY